MSIWRGWAGAAAPLGHPLVPFRCEIYRHEAARFARLRERRILIYWPHGLGDAVHLSTIIEHLEPSNSYFIARYGDDFSSLFVGARGITPLMTGIRSTHNNFGVSLFDFHVGIPYRRVRGRSEELHLTHTFAAAMRDAAIDTLLWTDYPDPDGRRAFPFHTKARALLESLTLPEHRSRLHLTEPLSSNLTWTDPPVDTVVDEVLAQAGLDVGLCVVQSGGHTNPHKVWPADELARWAELFLHEFADRRIITLDAILAHPRAHAFATLFADTLTTLPYGRVLKSFLRRAEIMVGVPAGPFHLAMTRPDIACVGLWRAHHPALYDEIRPRVRHLVARNATTCALMHRMGVRTAPQPWQAALQMLDGPEFPPAAVNAAIRSVLEDGHTAYTRR